MTRPNLTATITGRAAQDPEIRYTQTGQPITTISIPHTPRRKNPTTGQWEDHPGKDTTWIKLTLFGKDAETLANITRKGDTITATGPLTTDTWTNQNGEKRTNLTLIPDTWGIIPKEATHNTTTPTNTTQNHQSPAQTMGYGQAAYATANTNWNTPEAPF